MGNERPFARSKVNKGHFQKKKKDQNKQDVVVSSDKDMLSKETQTDQEPEMELEVVKSNNEKSQKKVHPLGAGRPLGSCHVTWIDASKSTHRRRVIKAFKNLKSLTCPSFDENSEKCWMELADLLSRI